MNNLTFDISSESFCLLVLKEQSDIQQKVKKKISFLFFFKGFIFQDDYYKVIMKRNSKINN